jgi:hypothetical protein
MEDEMDEMAGLAERLLRGKTGPVPKMTPQEMLRAINAATGKEPDVVAFVRCGRFGLALHDPKIRAEFTSPGDPDLLVSDALITVNLLSSTLRAGARVGLIAMKPVVPRVPCRMLFQGFRAECSSGNRGTRWKKSSSSLLARVQSAHAAHHPSKGKRPCQGKATCP